MNYYDRHIGDYLKDTAHLSLLQHGIYARLLDVYYTRESGIPEADALRLIGARSKEERAATLAVLSEFFKSIDGVWIQGRCDAEIARYQYKQEQARRSAEARWSESARNANALHKADAESMRTHSERNAKAMPQAAAGPPVPSPSPSPSPSQENSSSLRSEDRGDLPTPLDPPGTNGVAFAPPAVMRTHSERISTAKPKPKPPSAETWNAYAEAYSARYGAIPVRNAKVNAQLAQLVQRLGEHESPGVARFFVGHQNAAYVRSMHPVDLLLRDAESLRTAWVTGRQVTSTEARLTDRAQNTANAFAPLIAEARERDRLEALARGNGS